MIRYADDFIVTAASQELLSEIGVPVIRAFLAERGLELSAEKTRLVHIEEGFDFLGFNVRKYRGKLLIQPAQEKVRAFLRELKELITSHIGRPAAELIRKLNAKLRGWGHYYRHVVAKPTFGQVDREVANALWRWARRRHPHKPRQWIHAKYFRGTGEGRWAFGALHKRRDGTYERVDLFKVASIPIRRHVKIQAAANPYDPQYTRYFRRRWAMQQRRRDEDRRHFVAWRLGPMLGEC